MKIKAGAHVCSACESLDIITYEDVLAHGTYHDFAECRSCGNIERLTSW